MSESAPYNPAGSSRSSAGGAGAAGAQQPDFQQLAALLGNLMPLLLRFQLQFLQTPFQNEGFFGPGSWLQQEPLLDQQAAVSLTEDMIRGSLRTLSGYLDANAKQNEGLKQCLPIVAQATQNLAARNYAQAFNLIWMAYRAITAIRAADPRLPPLSGPGSEQHSSVH
jgi:hypothetical protein